MNSLRRRALSVLTTSVLLAGLASTARAQDAADVIAEDAAAFFGGLCVSTQADPDRIGDTIEKQQLKAASLSDEGVQTLLDGKPGDVGWLVETGRGVGLKLLVDPDATCEIQTTDLEDGTLQEVVASILETLSGRDGFAYKKALDDRRPTSGGEQHLVGYQLGWAGDGQRARIAVSFIAGDGANIPPQAQLVLTMVR